ncbi:MAG: MutH/Sau3AI family endonuclease [Nanoarchaeota archaeon]|nr:MutH/Sau3AI family endonuclease [Nanoarchaeota archaeon]
MGAIKDITQIRTKEELMERASWLRGKTLDAVDKAIKENDEDSRVLTKGSVGHGIEKGFFGINKNSDANPDIEHLGIEIKTCPLKYNKDKTRLSIKEPLSLNIINYIEEVNHQNLKDSSLYKKNKTILFIFYIHDKDKKRSEYEIKYVFLWNISDDILKELEPDYQLILKKIREGKAHEIHQSQHKFLTICPKHNGKFHDPTCKRSKRKQPFSDVPAEIRAFRLKNRYMNLIVSRHLGKKLKQGGWDID